ncbi:MAG TPA: hypothetical protein VE673_11780 [Pseudonocardiaceae bacterium]|nr:hypothetical protein [Pseudonocardiaceae bacterium]
MPGEDLVIEHPEAKLDGPKVVPGEYRRMLGPVRAHGEQLLRQAQATAENLITQPTATVHTIPHNAWTWADTLEQQSRDQVALPQHAELRQHPEIVTALHADKTTLGTSMEHRCAVESDYHHLTRPLFAQLRELDGPEPPSATPANARDIPARSSLHKHRWRCGAITVGPGCGCLSGSAGSGAACVPRVLGGGLEGHGFVGWCAVVPGVRSVVGDAPGRRVARSVISASVSIGRPR